MDDFHTSAKAYTDLTGRFPFQSSRGNNYLFILYDYDGNAILAEPIKNRQAATIKNAWLKLHSKLKLSGNKPKLYIMDNECSSDLKKHCKMRPVNSSLSLHMSIVAMPQNVLSVLSRTIFFQCYHLSIQHFLLAHGIT